MKTPELPFDGPLERKPGKKRAVVKPVVKATAPAPPSATPRATPPVEEIELQATIQTSVAGEDASRRAAREADRDARELAQTEFDAPLVLEAGAGTGKTATLVARILAWSLGKGWALSAEALAEHEPSPPRIAARVLSRIVAITFTDAAAGEMTERVGAALEELCGGGTPIGFAPHLLGLNAAEMALRARALSGALDHLGMRTIHSFCQRLLSDHPIEAGVHPSFTLDAEQRLVPDLARELLEEKLRAAWADPVDPDTLELARLGHGPAQIEETLLGLIRGGLPATALDEDPFTPERLRPHLGRVARLVGEALGCLPATAEGFGGKAKNAGEILQSLLDTREALEYGAPPDLEGLTALFQHLREQWPAAPMARMQKWAKDDFTASELKAIDPEQHGALVRACEDLVGELASLAKVDPALMQLLRRTLRPLLEDLQKALRARGILTFDQLLVLARDLLIGQPEVRRSVRAGLDQLLVDEFQDTDAVQCDLVRAIALDDPHEPHPGLFVVGDPKQSIYGWRGADLGAYQGFCDWVRAAGGALHGLVVNFRSDPPILDEVERVVSPVMIAETGLQPAFEALLPAPHNVAATGWHDARRAPVEYWVSWETSDAGPTRPRAEEAARLEAQALAADLEDLGRSPDFRWKDAAVLLRSTTNLDSYLGALRERSIPYRVERDRSYYRRREIVEATALIRCILDPCDALALVSYLRSAAVGVPDAAWIPLYARGLPQLFGELRNGGEESLAPIASVARAAAASLRADTSKTLQGLPGWEASLTEAARCIGALRADWCSLPHDAFVEAVRRRSFIEATEAARPLGSWRAANLERFFRRLREALETAAGDAPLVLRELARGTRGERDAEEARPKEGTEDAVAVMTMHKAKGLDFSHVYLMGLAREGTPPEREGTEVARLDGYYELRFRGTRTLGFAETRARADRTASAERIRLLYVAMTRAKKRVVLAGSWPEKDAPPPERAKSHMHLIARARKGGPSLAPLMVSLGKEGVRAFGDEEEARWYFPALAGFHGEEHREETPAPDVPTFDAGASEKLRIKREQAALRQARPFSGAASKSGFAPEHAQAAQNPTASANQATGNSTSKQDERIPSAVGTAIHALLERLDFEAPLDLDEATEFLECELQADLPLALVAPALESAGRMLQMLSKGDLLGRLQTLSPNILARELPVLLPPIVENESPESEAALAYTAGLIDLVYREPDTGRLVVADFKTGALAPGTSLEKMRAIYGAQGRNYTRALQEALQLAERPAFELWFLTADEVLRI